MESVVNRYSTPHTTWADQEHWCNWLYHYGKRMLANMGRCTNCGSAQCNRGRGKVCD